jgi:hypothetical protein
VPEIAKRHFTFSSPTVFESIGVRVVARVLARSRLCAGQPAAFAAHSGGGVPAGVAAAAAGAQSASAPSASAAAERGALRT